MISRANNGLTNNSIAYDGSTLGGPESFTNVKLKPTKFLDPDAKRSESQMKYSSKGKGVELLGSDLHDTNMRSLATDATPALRKPADIISDRSSIGDFRTSNMGSPANFTSATLRPRDTYPQLLWPQENTNKNLI
jgi:hypothetical protein